MSNVFAKCPKNSLLGKFFPFALVSLVFRVFTFSLTISLLKFYAIPLYAVLVLLAIGLGVFWNKDLDSFVIKGFQSVLFMGRQRNCRDIHILCFIFSK